MPLRGDFDSRALYVCRRSFPAPLGIVPWRRGMHLCVPQVGSGNLHRTAGCTSNYVSFRTSPLKWCGNLLRHCDRVLLKMEIATPVCALARNDRKFEARNDLEFGFAMTGNSMVRLRRRSIQQYASPE